MNDLEFKNLADQSLIALLVFDNKSNKIVYMNQRAKQTLHLKDMNNEDDFSKLHLEELFPKEESKDIAVGMSQELLKHEGLHQEVFLRRPDGSKLVGQIGIRHIKTSGEHKTLVMIQDMSVQYKLKRDIEAKQTDLKLAYQELLEQNTQLKELDLAKTKFIGLVTHELRTPTSGIVATAEMLKLGLYDTEEELKEFVGMIHSEGKILLELINDILDFAKIQSGRMDFYIDEQNLRETVVSTAESLQVMADEAGIKMIFDIPEKAFNCYFDKIRMHQIANNLISNAIKYNKENGSVELKIEDHHEVIRFCVNDTGKGIAPENHDKVFNEFETLGKISQHTKGTGLGLPIVKRMIESMGGKIDFTSELGKGSNFWVDIPTAKVLGDDSEHYRSRVESDSGDLAA